MESKISKTHLGSCHCGAVRFQVDVDATQGTRCNCTICTKLAQTGGIVKPEAFVLLSNESHLGMYEWGGKTAQRYFCRTCGVHCFGRGNLPQLGGDYVAVNFNCLDDIDLRDVKVSYWDGRHNNWQAGARPEPWAIATPS